MKTLLIVLVIVLTSSHQFPSRGMATYYTREDYGGGPLYCLGKYDESTLQTLSWVAVDVREFQSGKMICGDQLLICFEEGICVIHSALDAGPFEGYYVTDHPELPILVDFPEEQWPIPGAMSGVVEVLNLSELERRFQ